MDGEARIELEAGGLIHGVEVMREELFMRLEVPPSPETLIRHNNIEAFGCFCHVEGLQESVHSVFRLEGFQAIEITGLGRGRMSSDPRILMEFA